MQSVSRYLASLAIATFLAGGSTGIASAANDDNSDPASRILFGYAFSTAVQPDSFDKKAAPYRPPQSFYFAGYPVDPPNAPIISQNYTSFGMQRRNPADTWDPVARMCLAKPGWCCSLVSECLEAAPAAATAKPATGWTTIKR
jgi:hypothetical protein